MKHIVIVESPAKCKTINKYLGKDYTVLASYGHIRDLPSKNGSVLPDKDFQMNYEESDGSKKNIKAIKDAVKKADSLILATDPDREGEAISWHVLEMLKKSKTIKNDFPVKRISFSSITKTAVDEALNNPRELDMDLVNAQQARRALDYLVGFTLSPVLWRKLPGSRSAGRVQSVALRLICERETEIEKFRADEYWSVHGLFANLKKENFATNLTQAFGKKLEKLSVSNKAEADKILAEILKKNFSIDSVEKKQVSRNPKPPFTTSTLQQEASRKLGFSAKKTMMVAQKLYEGVDIGGETTGLITYMRTDGLDVAPEALAQTRTAITKNFGEKYLPEKLRVYKSKVKNAQEAHEAIRPTDPLRTPDSVIKYLDPDQQKLYELVWKRMIASQMESAQFNQVAVDVASEDKKFVFRATGNTIIFDGFYKLYREDLDDEDDEDAPSILPPLAEGEKVSFVKADEPNPNALQHFTSPPPRYNEASLVKKLEELSIGRPSTYAAIISVLQDRGYVRLEKRRFTPEMRGRLVTAFLEDFFTRYVEYDFTANLEEELDLVSEGKLDWRKALEKFWKDFKVNVDQAMEIKMTDVLDRLDKDMEHIFFHGEDIEKARVCPKCTKGKLSLKTGKFGAFLGCSSYPECDYTQQLDNIVDRKADDAAEAEASDPNLTDEERAENKKKAAQFETKILGKSSDGIDITLRKGPYGFYVQLGEAEGKVKPKRTGVPRGTQIDSIDLPMANQLLSLPRLIGKHPETGEDIKASIGMYGPYLIHNKRFDSIKPDKLFNISLEEAIEIVSKPKEKKARGGGFKKGKGKAKGKSKSKKAAGNSEE